MAWGSGGQQFLKKNNLGSKKIIWPDHFFRFSYLCDRVPPRLPPHPLVHTSFAGPPPQCILLQIVPFDLGNGQIPPRRIRFRGLQLPTRPAKALKIQFSAGGGLLSHPSFSTSSDPSIPTNAPTNHHANRPTHTS